MTSWVLCVHVFIGKKVAGDFHLDLEVGRAASGYQDDHQKASSYLPRALTARHAQRVQENHLRKKTYPQSTLSFALLRGVVTMKKGKRNATGTVHKPVDTLPPFVLETMPKRSGNAAQTILSFEQCHRFCGRKLRPARREKEPLRAKGIQINSSKQE
jgi:hypothetical protein